MDQLDRFCVSALARLARLLWPGVAAVWLVAMPLAAQVTSPHDLMLLRSATQPHFFGESGAKILGDLNGDLRADIGFGTRTEFQVFCGRTGALLYTLPDGSCCGEKCIDTVADLDGDQFPEVVTGCQYHNSDSGLVRVYSGRTGQLIPGYRWAGAANDSLGANVGGVGDLDNDGQEDIGAGSSSNFRVWSGRTASPMFQFGGATGGTGAGDVDGDGHDDVLIFASGWVERRSGRTGQLIGNRITVPGPHPNSVIAGHDVDGDGVPDFAVGHRYPTPGGMYVYSGRTEQQIGVFPGQSGETLGGAIDWVGDLTGDGFPEVVVNAAQYAGASYSSVAVYDLTPNGHGRLFTIRGGRDLGWHVGGGGDVNGDGVPDFVASRPHGSLISGGNSEARVFSGKELRLTANRYCIDITTGGTQMLTVHTGRSPGPSEHWMVLGSLRTSPCTPLDSGCLPLVPDNYMALTLAANLHGPLSTWGYSVVRFVVPPLPASVAGLDLYHASLRVDLNPLRLHSPSEAVIMALRADCATCN